MALDIGDKRIGLAIGGSGSALVSELEFISRGEKELEEIDKVVRKKGVKEIIIGYPLGLSGKPTAQTRKVLAFYQNLKKFLGNVPIILWDERLTTQLAVKSLKDRGERKISRKKGRLDALSAAFILQSYLDYQRNKE